jgi:uncharacterized membrane protein
MSISRSFKHIVHRPRLVTSALVATAFFFVLLPAMPVSRALLIAFDAGAGLFLVLVLILMFSASVESMRARAKILDEGKWAVTGLSICVAAVVLVALSHELHAARDKSLGDVALASCTIFLAWLFVALVFAEHYAHSFYTEAGQLVFPGTETPDYLDFTYFSLVLSMCCQTSDVAITSSAFRRPVMLHSVVAFFFNVIIIAITVSVVAGVL